MTQLVPVGGGYQDPSGRFDLVHDGNGWLIYDRMRPNWGGRCYWSLPDAQELIHDILITEKEQA